MRYSRQEDLLRLAVMMQGSAMRQTSKLVFQRAEAHRTPFQNNRLTELRLRANQGP